MASLESDAALPQRVSPDLYDWITNANEAVVPSKKGMIDYQRRHNS